MSDHSRPRQVKPGDPIGLPPPPVVDVPVEASAKLGYYQVAHDLVGHWYQGEVVAAEELGDVAERARLLQGGAITPVVGQPSGLLRTRAEAFAATGGMPNARPQTMEEIIARTIVAVRQHDAA